MANNNKLYNSAVAGALSAVGSRWITSQVPSEYQSSVNAIEAFAIQFDSVIPPEIGEATEAQARLVQSLANSFWQERNPTSTIASDYNFEATNLAAVYQLAKLLLLTE